jgi:GNAT superfamily N-acetyltransferase
MAWRLSHAAFQRNKGARNKQALHGIVASKEPAGMLAYSAAKPVGWCAIAPPEAYVRLENSRVLKPVDDRTVWSVSCFFVSRPYRRTGFTQALLEAAVEYARQRGAKIVEGYPQDVQKDLPGAFVWTGVLATYRRAGFKEVVRRSPTRPIVRKDLHAQEGRFAG